MPSPWSAGPVQLSAVTTDGVNGWGKGSGSVTDKE